MWIQSSANRRDEGQHSAMYCRFSAHLLAVLWTQILRNSLRVENETLCRMLAVIYSWLWFSCHSLYLCFTAIFWIGILALNQYCRNSVRCARTVARTLSARSCRGTGIVQCQQPCSVALTVLQRNNTKTVADFVRIQFYLAAAVGLWKYPCKEPKLVWTDLTTGCYPLTCSWSSHHRSEVCS